MMMIFYLGTGALIAGVLSLFIEKDDQSKPTPIQKYVTACLLTVVLWPIVLVLAAASSKAFRQGQKLVLTKSDLVNRVDAPLNQAQYLSFNKGAHFSKSPDDHQIWTFRTHNRRRAINTMIVEGYAIVDNNNDIVDYVVLDEYPEQLSVLH